jgi:hypothetical protein
MLFRLPASEMSFLCSICLVLKDAAALCELGDSDALFVGEADALSCKEEAFSKGED